MIYDSRKKDKLIPTTTLATYKTRVRNKLDDTSFSDSKLTQFADETNKDICNSYRWPFMEEVLEGTIAQGTTTYSFTAADHQVTINLSVVSPNNRAIPLEYVPFEQFDRDYPDPSALTQAAPEVWTQFGTSFIVGPASPDTTYSLYMRYLKNPTTISADANTLDVPDDFSELVTLGMLWRAYQSDDEWDLAGVVRREYDLKLQQMSKRLLKRQAGGSVKIPNSRGSRPSWITW